MRRNDGITPGGINDPVAQNIRAEMNQDARPTAEEAKREHRKFLREEGCSQCDENDPDVLEETFPRQHNCPGAQAPPPEPTLFCEDCKPENIWEWQIEQRLETYRDVDDVVGVAIYECDIIAPIRLPEPPTVEVEEMVGCDEEGNPVYETVEIEDTRERVVPNVDVKHVRCGARIEDIRLFEDDGV